MKTPASIKLLVVDDHFVVRRGLAASLGLDARMQVVAEAESAQEAIDLYARFSPDVVIMDLRLPDMSGIEATAALRARDSNARVIILSTYQSGEQVYAALKAGARAYLSKSTRREDLLDTIQAVFTGEYRLPPEVSAALARYASLPQLTGREAGILQLIVEGHSNKEIASVLSLTEGTVKIHVNHLLKKLQVSDRTQAAVYALRNGLAAIE
jgi:two-component system, NarL family, response regulator